MDGDDVCVFDRFSRQIDFMEFNQDIDVVGGSVKMFRSDGFCKNIQFPENTGLLHFGMFMNCILVHPTIMFRSSLFINKLEVFKFSNPSLVSNDLFYSSDFEYAEDYALWLSLICSRKVRLANLGNPIVLRLRKHQTNQSNKNRDKQKLASSRALFNHLEMISNFYKNFQDNKIRFSKISLLPETVDAMLSIIEFTSVEQLEQAIIVLEMIEDYLNCGQNLNLSDKNNVSKECTRRMSEYAVLEMKMSNSSPSSLPGWITWISRNPIEFLSMLINKPIQNPILLDNFQSTNNISIICFSKDRAFQLSEYLRTLYIFVIDKNPQILFDISVLWTSSTSSFLESYQIIQKKYPKVKWLKETNFSTQISELVQNSSDYILWGVDDVLYYNFIDILPILQLMSNENLILCSHLKLSPNITFCHPSQSNCKLPEFKQVEYSPHILTYNRNEANQDWNYPFELCATLMHKVDVIESFQLILQQFGPDGLSHPNKLEVSGSRLFKRNLHSKSHLNTCICLKSPIMSVITVNRVQDVCKNVIYEEKSLEELDNYLRCDRHFDLNYYKEKKFNSVHIGDFILE